MKNTQGLAYFMFGNWEICFKWGKQNCNSCLHKSIWFTWLWLDSFLTSFVVQLPWCLILIKNPQYFQNTFLAFTSASSLTLGRNCLLHSPIYAVWIFHTSQLSWHQCRKTDFAILLTSLNLGALIMLNTFTESWHCDGK